MILLVPYNKVSLLMLQEQSRTPRNNCNLGSSYTNNRLLRSNQPFLIVSPIPTLLCPIPTSHCRIVVFQSLFAALNFPPILFSEQRREMGKQQPYAGHR